VAEAKVVTWGVAIDFLIKSGEKPASEKDWVTAGLRLANMSKPEDAADISWFFATVFFGIAPRLSSGQTLSGWRAGSASNKEVLQGWYNSFRTPSRWLREVFCAVVSDCYEAIQTYGPDVDKRCQEVRMFGHPQFRDDILVDELRVMARSIDSAIGYVAALFLDPRRNFGERLRMCPYVSDEGVACGRFFLRPVATGPGSPSKYCTPSHQSAAKKQSSRQRSKNNRDRKKLTNKARRSKRGKKS